MNREKVKSKLVASIGYSPAEKICEVELVGGKVYRYSPMEPEEYREFIGADSVGKHFLAKVKPCFACTKVLPEKTDAQTSETRPDAVDPEDIAPDDEPLPGDE
jgi:KTSC domain-containing protein